MGRHRVSGASPCLCQARRFSLRYPGRRFAGPGLISFALSGRKKCDNVWQKVSGPRKSMRLRRFGRKALDGRLQGLEVDGLGEVFVKTRFKTRPDVFVRSIAAQGDALQTVA